MTITDGQSMAMYMWEHYYSKHQMPPELGTKGQVLASDGDKLVWETPAVPETVGINSRLCFKAGIEWLMPSCSCPWQAQDR